MTNVTMAQLVREVMDVVDGDPREFIISAVRAKLADMQQEESVTYNNTNKDPRLKCPKTNEIICFAGEPCEDCQCADGWEQIPF